MTRQKLVHIHSIAKNDTNDGPKLPTSDQIEYGEIAVNYLKGNETISIKNNSNEIKSLSLNAPFFFNSNGQVGIESASSRGGASGSASHAEGNHTTASADYSHAEGSLTIASGSASHAEGNHTTASYNECHAEGYGGIASSWCAHAEGNHTTASAYFSHAEGTRTTASGYASHAEGCYTYAHGDYSHAQGRGGNVLCLKGKVIDTAKKTFELYLNYGGEYFYSDNSFLNIVWPYITDDVKPTLFMCGERYFYKTWDTLKQDVDNHIGDNCVTSINICSAKDPVYNPDTKTLTFTEDFSSFAENTGWTDLFNKFPNETDFYVIWMLNSVAYNVGSHVEGLSGICYGKHSHCEGHSNLCNGDNSFVGGEYCINRSNESFVHGYYLLNRADNYNSTTIGKFNSPVEDGVFIIGLGSDDNNRTNALTVTSGGLFQTSAAWTTSSDVRLKNVIDDTISVDVNKVAEMPVFTYTRKDLEKSQTMIGSSAQYWQEILPESVKEDENGYLSLDYNGILLSCVKSLANAVETYKSEIEDLKKEIEELKNK